MKILFLAILTGISFLVSVPETPMENQKNDCSFMVVEKITFGIDQIMASSFNDTIKTMHITVVNRCKTCKPTGPDYCPLVVTNKNNDTIAVAAINGIPRKYKDKRTYQVNAYKKNWEKNPSPENLRISISPYCNELLLKLK